MAIDIDEAILEFFEENDWDMSMDQIEECAGKLISEFENIDEAQTYVQAYLQSMFE